MEHLSKPYIFTEKKINKIGTAILYLLNGLPKCDRNKILAILFITEESSVKKFGIPFFNIDFYLWKMGPVAKDLYIDLSEPSPFLLRQFIAVNVNAPTYTVLNSFNANEFSDNDLELFDQVISYAESLSAEELLMRLRGSDSLWRMNAIRNDILHILEFESLVSSDYKINFELLFENNHPSTAFLKEQYKLSREKDVFDRQLNGKF